MCFYDKFSYTFTFYYIIELCKRCKIHMDKYFSFHNIWNCIQIIVITLLIKYHFPLIKCIVVLAHLKILLKRNSYLSYNQSWWCCRWCYLVDVAFSNNKTISLSLIVKGFLYLFFMRWEGYLLCELIFFIAYSNIYCWCWFFLMLPNTQKLTEQ